MSKQFDPWLLPYDNAMEAWMVEFRRRNLHVVKKYEDLPESLKPMAGRCYWEPVAPHQEQRKPRILLADEPKITAPLWFKVFFVVMYAAAIGVVIWALSNIHF